MDDSKLNSRNFVNKQKTLFLKISYLNFKIKAYISVLIVFTTPVKPCTGRFVNQQGTHLLKARFKRIKIKAFNSILILSYDWTLYLESTDQQGTYPLKAKSVAL